MLPVNSHAPFTRASFAQRRHLIQILTVITFAPIAPVANAACGGGGWNPSRPSATKTVTPESVKKMTDLHYALDLADVQVRYNDMERAEATLRSALKLAEDSADKQHVAVMLGTLLKRGQGWQAAETFYNDLMTQTPDICLKGQLAMQLCDVYLQSNQADLAEKALSDFDELAWKDPKPEYASTRSAVWHRLLPYLRLGAGKIAKVTASLEADLARNPDDPTTLERLADVYTAASKLLPVLEKLSSMKPSDTQVLSRLASFYHQTNQYDKAIGAYKMLAEVNPGIYGARSHYQIADLLLKSGKKVDAIAWAKANLPDEKGASSTALLRASFFEDAGMIVDAQNVYAKLASDAQTAQEKVDYVLRSANLSRKVKDFAKAETLIREAIRIAGDDKSMLDRANQALARLNEDHGKS